MKLARVCIIHKGGTLTNLNNYRPISVLPLFSKIAEKVINTRFSKYFLYNNIITSCQYGFQKGKSTETALLCIKNKIISNIENRLYTLGIFLDFRKAFDSIKHDILLGKLQRYGIRGLALELIKNYLSARRQFTSLNGFTSQTSLIQYDVPQGSILGPLLFLAYINDIVNIPRTPDIILYADDTNVFFSGTNLDEIEQCANCWLNELSQWLRSNQLELNTAKTKYVIFRSRNKLVQRKLNVTFLNSTIESTSAHKFLGVWFEEFLSWTNHVNKIRCDISRSIGILNKVRHLLPNWLKLQLYYIYSCALPPTVLSFSLGNHDKNKH